MKIKHRNYIAHIRADMCVCVCYFYTHTYKDNDNKPKAKNQFKSHCQG